MLSSYIIFGHVSGIVREEKGAVVYYEMVGSLIRFAVVLPAIAAAVACPSVCMFQWCKCVLRWSFGHLLGALVSSGFPL